jgi:hypothetical protein
MVVGQVSNLSVIVEKNKKAYKIQFCKPFYLNYVSH